MKETSMFKSWTFSRKLVAGFTLAGLILLTMMGAAYRTTERLIKNDAWVTHSYTTRIELTNLLVSLLNAETGQRGYLITGRDSYLEPYQTGLQTHKIIFDNLKNLAADDLAQQQRLAIIDSTINAKLAELSLTIGLRRKQNFDAAKAVVVNDTGKIYMDHIRELIVQADHEEAVHLEKRRKQAKESAYVAIGIMMGGGLLGAFFVSVIGWIVTRSLSQQIGGAVGQVQSSSAELTAAANQQVNGAREQATAMTEMSTTINELMVTSRQIAESAQQVAKIAEQTANAASLGHGTVDLTHESIAGIRGQVDQIVEHMLELGKKSQEIGAVLDIVTELAEQTNILAINATIEAAGAGEQGKRFSVVADEIRKLADRVSGSTKEIRTLIDDVRSAVNTTVMATETGSKSVDAGSRLFSDVAASFKQIANLVVTTTEAAREIELSTKQQSTAVEQVNAAISSVAQAAKETETSSGQTLTTASQLARLSGALAKLIRQQPRTVKIHAI